MMMVINVSVLLIENVIPTMLTSIFILSVLGKYEIRMYKYNTD